MIDGQSSIRLFDRMTVEIAGRPVTPPGRQGRMLLAYLVANRLRVVRRDELIDVIWEGRQPESPEAVLNSLLSRLRRALGSDRLDSRAHVSLRLPEDTWVDLEAAEQQAAEALDALGREDARQALELARGSLRLTKGELLPGLEGRWIDERRRELEDLELSLLEVSAEAGLRLGGVELRSAERSARELVEKAPYRESGYALLMRLHAARGDSAEAVRIYDRLRVLLREELGTAPAPEVTALNERLLRQEQIAESPTSAAVPEKASASVGPSEGTPFPPLLNSLLEERFVGREELRRRVWECWHRARARPRLVALTGEPGIGKTRLAACLATQVRGGGGTVLYGRCDEDPPTSYQPFVEALDHHLRHVDLASLLSDLPNEAADLRRLPALRARLGGGAEPGSSAAGGDRYALFEAVAAVLRRANRERPLLFVVDDLHWADGPTFQLLLHLLRTLDPGRCMFLTTLRDVDASSETATGDERAVESPDARIAALRREAEVERLCLEGFDERETAKLISARADREPEEPFARRLKELTGGNPFFMVEALRSLNERRQAHGGELIDLEDMGIPEGVREMVTRRLDRLSADASEAVAAAAVIGPEFELCVLEAVLEWPTSRVLGAVERLIDAGLLVEVPAKPDRFAFTHALVRETQYRGLLTAARRALLHEQIGLELERRANRAEERDGVAPSELAHHFYEARSRVGLERAAHYSISAADHAARELAYEEAAAHYERALELLKSATPQNEERLCELRLSQGNSLLPLGRVGEARDFFRIAAESARRRGAADQLARAALGFHGRYTAAGEVDKERIELLEEALARLGSEDTALRARVLARLADSVLFVPESRALELSAEAVAMARRVGDACAILEALSGRHAALLHAEHLDERLKVSRERLEIATEVEDREATATALQWHIQNLCDRGDMRVAKEHHARLVELALELRQPLYLSYARHWESTFAQLHGRFDEAERLADEASELALRAQGTDAEMQRVAKRLFIYREQGRLEELRPAVARFAAEAPNIKAWSALLALVDAEDSLTKPADVAMARSMIDRLVKDRGVAIPRDVFWITTVAVLAEACSMLEDTAAPAASLYRLLLPYEDQYVHVTLNACLGSVARFLGLAATACGNWEAADGHFSSAAERNKSIGSSPLFARTRVDHAEMLLRSGDPTRREEADRLLVEARSVAEPLGMAELCRRVARLRDRVNSPVAG